MELRHNPAPAEVIHVDLNSAFAMTEQQANPLLRGRPVGVTNRLNKWAICITASHEAKIQGIGLGMQWRDALARDPNFVMLESDAAKYSYVHKQLREMFESYSPVAYMKSVDEGIIDFRGMRPILKGRSLEEIGYEIKQRIKDEVGDYMTVNVGIAQNRWLAKVAASFMKPDGMYRIDQANIESVYAFMDLVDLPYIKRRNKERLQNAGISTPLEFYRASEPVLVKQVFGGINGHHWYLKLRGYETEVEYGVRTVGRSYVLEHRTSDPAELALLFYKAAVKLSRRLARFPFAARGLALSLHYATRYQPLHTEDSWRPSGWYARNMYRVAHHRADQLYERIMELFRSSPTGEVVSGMFVTCYGLEPRHDEQPMLFEDEFAKRERLEQAINSVNDRFGDLTIQPAAVAKSKNPMKDKIPFGSIRYFE